MLTLKFQNVEKGWQVFPIKGGYQNVVDQDGDRVITFTPVDGEERSITIGEFWVSCFVVNELGNTVDRIKRND